MADVDKRSSVIDEEEKRAHLGRIRPLGGAAALAVLILVLVLPALYRPTLYGKLPFDAHIARDIETLQPEYVFIGNSMLGTRIDEATLAGKLGS